MNDTRGCHRRTGWLALVLALAVAGAASAQDPNEPEKEDFAAVLSPCGPLRRALRRFGAVVPGIPGTEASRLEALRSLFQAAGLEQIDTRTIDVCLAYADFQDFWQAQTPGYAPITKIIAAMKDSERMRLKRAVQSTLPNGPNGSIEYCARANAIKTRVPR